VARPGFWRALRTSFALNRPRGAEPVELVSAGVLGPGRAAYRPSALLLPARPLFIWGTLLAALLLNLLPAGPTPGVPDFLALALVFWNVHQPRRVGIGAAFVAGLLMDVHDGALFGEHALAYTLLAYGAITLHRRVLWFPLGAQALHVLALLLNLLPAGPTPGVPDFLALALVFWNVHQPRRVGIGAAFVAGLLMDVHDGALFGEHALAYTLLAYGAITLHRRMLWFPLGAQALHVLALLLLAQAVSLVVRLWVGGSFPGWGYFLASATGAVLWPLVSWVLLAPQRRPAERDDTRPL
jgi:rod shape-determining protein MreD